jgi:hypothetical protein
MGDTNKIYTYNFGRNIFFKWSNWKTEKVTDLGGVDYKNRRYVSGLHPVADF